MPEATRVASKVQPFFEFSSRILLVLDVSILGSSIVLKGLVILGQSVWWTLCMVFSTKRFDSLDKLLLAWRTLETVDLFALIRRMSPSGWPISFGTYINFTVLHCWRSMNAICKEATGHSSAWCPFLQERRKNSYSSVGDQQESVVVVWQKVM